MPVKTRNSHSLTDLDADLVDSDSMPGSVRLPEFWARQPALWFVQAESQFAVKGITVEATKHATVEVASRVKDELLSPDARKTSWEKKRRLRTVEGPSRKLKRAQNSQKSPTSWYF